MANKSDLAASNQLNISIKVITNAQGWKNQIRGVYTFLYPHMIKDFVHLDDWKQWRDAYVPYLLGILWKDEVDGCKQGTWNYGHQEFHGSETSRVLIHCYYTLAITVSTRYDMVNKPKKP